MLTVVKHCRLLLTVVNYCWLGGGGGVPIYRWVVLTIVNWHLLLLTRGEPQPPSYYPSWHRHHWNNLTSLVHQIIIDDFEYQTIILIVHRPPFLRQIRYIIYDISDKMNIEISPKYSSCSLVTSPTWLFIPCQRGVPPVWYLQQQPHPWHQYQH